MPYFIRPSRNLGAEAKRAAYAEARAACRATLSGETDELVKMVTLNCLLKTHLPYFYWVGFYLVSADDPKLLKVGPYQGTLGCLSIRFGRGVCGTVAATGQTKILVDTHAVVQGSEHIACDPNSRSEIVLPVNRPDGTLLGVFDVDSTELGSFDHIDREELEALLAETFSLPA